MILQYSYKTKSAVVYKPGAASSTYSGSLLDAVVTALSALVPSGQSASMFEIDGCDDVPSAYTETTTTDDDGNTSTVSTPSEYRHRVTGVVATDLGAVAFDSETAADALQTALLALWADMIQ